MRAFASLVVLTIVTACTPKAPQIEITDPVIIATPTGGAAYFTIHNEGGGDRLLSVETPSIGEASMHETTRDGSITRMRAVEAVDIPAGGDIVFERGGLHVMLMGSTGALQPGKPVQLTISFERSGNMTITAPIKAPDAPMEAM